MQHVNAIEQAKILPAAIAEAKAIRQLIKAADVARKLGVSISWVLQHASGKRKPYLPAVKMGPGRSPLRFDPADVEKFIDECRRIAGQRAEYARR
jgi:predicted DNA-binding transcriptional regulator AlpA